MLFYAKDITINASASLTRTANTRKLILIILFMTVPGLSEDLCPVII